MASHTFFRAHGPKGPYFTVPVVGTVTVPGAFDYVKLYVVDMVDVAGVSRGERYQTVPMKRLGDVNYVPQYAVRPEEIDWT